MYSISNWLDELFFLSYWFMLIHHQVCHQHVHSYHHLYEWSFKECICNKSLTRFFIYVLVWIIFLCISSAISQSHFIFQSCHINCDYFDLEVALSDWYQFFINAATWVLYMFILITHMRLELACSCSTKRSLSVYVSLMTSAFIFASQYAWWIY